MSVKQGIKEFSKKWNEALLKELNQLHEWEALLPLRKEDMSQEQRRKALWYLMFLKEKHDDTIKARGCTDRRSQRLYNKMQSKNMHVRLHQQNAKWITYQHMNGSAKTPAAGNLLSINPEARKLPEEATKVLAKLLYLLRHTRQDIHTAVAFLWTRVESPDKDDIKKLPKVMQYLHCTKELTLTIEPDKSTQWLVDSSYAVHLDMCSHSGIIMMLEKGVVYSTLCKQKINTKSSTEAELVAIDDAMGQVLWTWRFLAAKGMAVTTTKTTRVPYYSRKMVLHQAASIQSTSTYDNSLWQTR